MEDQEYYIGSGPLDIIIIPFEPTYTDDCSAITDYTYTLQTSEDVTDLLSLNTSGPSHSYQSESVSLLNGAEYQTYTVTLTL